MLGEKGVNLSGWPKKATPDDCQAIRLPSELLVFDDNLSAVDYNTESTIQKELISATIPNKRKHKSSSAIAGLRW